MNGLRSCLGAFTLGLFVSLIACGMGQQASRGGGVTEIPNNVAARILDADMQPLANVPVLKISSEGWLAKARLGDTLFTQTSLMTDSNGWLVDSSSTNDRLWVKWKGKQAFVTSWKRSQATQLILEDPASIHGKLPLLNDQYPTFIYLQGAPWKIPVDALGHFSADSLPAGLYQVSLQYQNETGIQMVDAEPVVLHPGQSLEFSPSIRSNRFLLDDFEDEDFYPRTREYFGTDQWTIALLEGASATDDGWHAKPDWNMQMQIVTLDNLQSFLRVSPGTAPAWRLETKLGKEKCGEQMNDMDSVVIQTQGQGTWRIGFTIKDDDIFGQWYGALNLTGQWSTFSIPVSSFHNSAPTLETENICNFWIQPMDNVAKASPIAIESITFTGINLNSLVHSRLD